VHALIPNNDISFGLAIILFTVIIRLVLLPLSIKQTKSTAKMGAIQPEMKKVQEKYKSQAQIAPLPCGGLVELIESGNIEGELVEKYLRDKFMEVKSDKIASVVLGCTHYPFVRETITKILGENVPVIDGSDGTSRHLKNILEENNMLSESKDKGKVEIYNSLEDEAIIKLSYTLLNK